MPKPPLHAWRKSNLSPAKRRAPTSRGLLHCAAKSMDLLLEFSKSAIVSNDVPPWKGRLAAAVRGICGAPPPLHKRNLSCCGALAASPFARGRPRTHFAHSCCGRRSPNGLTDRVALIGQPVDAPLSVKHRHSTPEEPLDAPRDNPPSLPPRSSSAPAAPRPWPTTRDLRASNPLSQDALRTPQSANAPAGWPGRSLLACWRASFARAS